MTTARNLTKEILQVNFFEENFATIMESLSKEESQNLTQLWDALLNHLLDLTKSANQRVKEYAIVAVAAIADSTKANFMKVCTLLHPFLQLTGLKPKHNILTVLSRLCTDLFGNLAE